MSNTATIDTAMADIDAYRDAMFLGLETHEQQQDRLFRESLNAIMSAVPGGGWDRTPTPLAPVPYIWWKEITGEQVKVAVGEFIAGIAVWCAAVNLISGL